VWILCGYCVDVCGCFVHRTNVPRSVDCCFFSCSFETSAALHSRNGGLLEPFEADCGILHKVTSAHTGTLRRESVYARSERAYPTTCSVMLMERWMPFCSRNSVSVRGRNMFEPLREAKGGCQQLAATYRHHTHTDKISHTCAGLSY
jgi:hypothetical protein